LFNWLLALDDRDYDTWDKGRISWHVRYQRTASRTQRPPEASKTAAKAASASAMMVADQATASVDADKLHDDDEVICNFF
jgi:hypothetical protein